MATMYLQQVDNNIKIIKEKERAGQLEKMVFGSSLLSVAVIEHHDKTQFREDGVYLVSSRSSARDTNAGTWTQELRDHRAVLFTILLPKACSVCFLVSPRMTWTLPYQSRKCPRGRSTDN